MKKDISIETLKKSLLKGMSLRGIDAVEADFIADDYIEAELCGKSSHGLSKYLLLDAALAKREGDIELIFEKGNYAKIDGKKNLGHICGKYCIEKVIELATTHDNAFVALSNSSRYSRLKPFARMIAQAGYIGIVMNNGGPAAVAPYGGTTPIFGTNPICFSFPSRSGEPFIFDFSTSKKVWGEIRQAILEKRLLPEDCFFDSEGNPTTDPQKADAVKPFGDAKGYALCYALEILTGAYVGCSMGGKVNDEYDLGFLFIALSPEMFSSLNEFSYSVDFLAEEVRESKRVNNERKVYVPGERATQLYKNGLMKGTISLEEDIIERILIMEKTIGGGINSSNKMN